MNTNKLSIAIVIPGHLRYWTDCKENFLENLYDESHNIDVFIDTYNSVFRTDYHSYNEFEKKHFLDEKQIKQLFDGINVVSFNIDDDDTKHSQETKLKNVHESLVQHKKKYDLIVRTRFDIFLEKKINYFEIYKQCMENPKLIFIGKGGADGLLNDMFAVCLPEAFDIYADRFKYGDVAWQEEHMHGSLKQINFHHGIVYNTDTWILLKRVDGNIYLANTSVADTIIELAVAKAAFAYKMEI